MRSFKVGLVSILTGLVSFLQSRADPPAVTPRAFPHPLTNATLSPALQEAAERDHIALSQTSDVGKMPAVGDSEVFWIGSTSGDTTTQWLVQLTRAATSAKEQTDHRGKETTRYLSWGPAITFKSDVEALDLWIAGPVDTSMSANDKKRALAPAQVRTVRLFVAKDFLRLGLDDSERVASFLTRRTREIAKQDPKFTLAGIYALDHPLKRENIGYSKPVAERIGFTPEMERAWIGGYVALQTFYELAEEVPAIKEIAEIAFAKPSIFKLGKMAFGAQFQTNIGGLNQAPLDPAKIDFLPMVLESFEVPFAFAFDRTLIATGAMIVTKPWPPMDVSAGILALVAVHPRDATRAIELKLIGSGRGRLRNPGNTDMP